MPEGLYPPSALVGGALIALLCIAPPVLAEPRPNRPADAGSVIAASAHAYEMPTQLDFFAVAGTWFTTEFDARDFDVERFEASLPRALAAPAAQDPAATALAAAQSDERKAQSKSAADRPRKRTPAAKSPPRSGATSGKANGTPTRTSVPVGRVVAAAPPATITHVRPRAAKPDHGPRELFIARVPPSDLDEAIPPQKIIPVIRASLLPPPPALALK